jgi:hypothetical protein
MMELPRAHGPAPEPVAARLARDGQLFDAVVERLRREEPIESWPRIERCALLVACMPNRDHLEGAGFWRWTIEGDKANRLLRFLVYLPRQQPFVKRLKAERQQMPEEIANSVATAAELMRARLPKAVHLWSLVSSES